MVWITCKVRKF